MLIKHTEQGGELEFQMLSSTLSKAKSKTLSAFLYIDTIFSIICYRKQMGNVLKSKLLFLAQ